MDPQSKRQAPLVRPPEAETGLKPDSEMGTVLFDGPGVRVVRLDDGTECGDEPWVAVERRTGANTWETVPVLKRGQDGLNAVVYALGRAVADLVARREDTRSREPLPHREDTKTEGATP